MIESAWGVLLVLTILGVGIMPIVAVVLLVGNRRTLRALRDEQKGIRDSLRRLAERPVAEREAATAEAPEESVRQASEMDRLSPQPPAVPSESPAAEPRTPIGSELAPMPGPPPLPTPSGTKESEPVSDEAKLPPEPSPAVVALRRAWNWFLVGDEDRAKSVSTEYAVASTWLTRFGVAALVACIGYFLKWSIDRELLGPAGRVAISVLTGTGMVAFGAWLLGRQTRLIGQGLMGGGLLSLYFSIYAANQMYGLISLMPAFVLMLILTFAAGWLSVRTNSLLIAVLALIGGYLTPVFVRGPEPNLPVLFATLLLLSGAILAIARFRDWKLLNWLGFFFTYALVVGGLQTPLGDRFWIVLGSLTAIFAVHSSLCYTYVLGRPGRHVSSLDAAHMILNAVVYAFIAYWLVEDRFGRPYPCFVALGMALFYLGHFFLFLKRGLADRVLSIALIGLSAAFTTWTLPLVFEKESLTLALALVAIVFLWLGVRARSGFLRLLGRAVYLVVFFRLLALDFPGSFGKLPADLGMSAYWAAMVSRLWTFGISIASIAGATVIEHRSMAMSSIEARKPTRSVTANVFFWGSVVCILVFALREVDAMFAYWSAFRPTALTFVWCALALYFVLRSVRQVAFDRVSFTAASVVLFIVVVKVFGPDSDTWALSSPLWFASEYRSIDVVARVLDFGFLGAVLAAAGWLAGVRRDARRVAAVYGYASLAVLFLYTSLEVSTFLQWRAPDFRNGGMSILWALFAIGFVGVGIRRSLRGLRYWGLALFALVVFKVFLVDLADMAVMHRVVAFMVVGIALLLGAFGYVRAGRPTEGRAER